MKRNWLLFVLLTVGLPAAAAEMYSWTDANGVKHFSDSPPPASVTKAQKLKLKGGVTTGDATEEATQKEEAAKNSGPALAAAAGYAPEDIKHNCEIARKNQATLDSQKPALDADGYPVDLDGAKTHQAQVDKFAQQVKLFCTN
ncbi:MAG: DUF4124 domain-containing protein [Dokdonella sp.]